MKARRELELDLRRAVANHEFELYFQAQVNVNTSRSAELKHCCAGGIRGKASFLPASSFPLPKRLA